MYSLWNPPVTSTGEAFNPTRHVTPVYDNYFMGGFHFLSSLQVFNSLSLSDCSTRLHNSGKPTVKGSFFPVLLHTKPPHTCPITVRLLTLHQSVEAHRPLLTANSTWWVNKNKSQLCICICLQICSSNTFSLSLSPSLMLDWVFTVNAFNSNLGGLRVLWFPFCCTFLSAGLQRKSRDCQCSPEAGHQAPGTMSRLNPRWKFRFLHLFFPTR